MCHHTVYAKVGQLKGNNNTVIFHLSMKFSDRFDQNPPVRLTKLRKKHSNKKHSQFDLECKGQGHSKKQKPMP